MDTKFELGQVVITPRAEDILSKSKTVELLIRHSKGDWGDLCEEDKQENEDALVCGNRIFNSYKIDEDTKVWLITEWDRSYTTILLPDEY